DSTMRSRSRVSHLPRGPGSACHAEGAGRGGRGSRHRLVTSTPTRRQGAVGRSSSAPNLLFACEICNRREKRNWFPVEKGSKRGRSPRHPIAAERARFVDPSQEAPEEAPEAHLTFREHLAIPVNGSKRGKITRRALGLNRPDLKARREDHLRRLHLLYE